MTSVSSVPCSTGNTLPAVAPVAPSFVPQVVPMDFVRCILLAYAKYGIDPARALSKAQIRPNSVQKTDARVTIEQFEDFNWEAMQELDDEALGWFSRKLPWGTYGMLCRASLGAPTLGIALHRWTRHHRLLTDDIFLTLNVTDETATIEITETRDLGDFRVFCLLTLLRYILGFACWAIDEKIPLISAEFPCAPPEYSDVYSKLFSPNLHFSASHARFHFSKHYLEQPLQRDEAAINLMLKRALPLTVLPYKNDHRLASQVRRLLRMAKTELPSAEDVAALFNLSVRTLHRRLTAEGASLRQLKKQVQMEQAKEALTRTTQPIKRVAFIAGFRSEKSFSRAFHNATNETPSMFRKRLQAAK